MPSLFYSSRDGEEKDWQPRHVLVWFQVKATEDGVIAAWLSDLIVQEGDKFSLSTTDCVASEHSAEMRLKIWFNNSVEHVIGMGQTGKTQVTDYPLRQDSEGCCQAHDDNASASSSQKGQATRQGAHLGQHALGLNEHRDRNAGRMHQRQCERERGAESVQDGGLDSLQAHTFRVEASTRLCLEGFSLG